MAKMEHSNIVTVHAVDEENGQPFMVMQLVKGLSVEDILAAIGPLGEHEALRIATEAAKGIAEAHQNGLVHRDIKPANILIEERTRRVLVTDFGIAIDKDEERMTRAGSGMGTRGFWAPEQRDDSKLPVDARSDVYGLGCTLFRTLTGKLPSEDLFMRVDVPEEGTLEGIHPEIASIIKRAVKWHPDERYPSMDAMREVMEKAMKELPESEPMPFPKIPWLSEDSSVSSEPNSNPTAIPTPPEREFIAPPGTDLPWTPPSPWKPAVGTTIIGIIVLGGWLALKDNKETPVAIEQVPVVEQMTERVTTGAAATAPEPIVEQSAVAKPEPVAVITPTDSITTKVGKPKPPSPTPAVTKPTKPTEAPKVVEAVTPIAPSVGQPQATVTGNRVSIDVAVAGMTNPTVIVRYRPADGSNWQERSMTPTNNTYHVEFAFTGELANGAAYYIEASAVEGKKRSGSVVNPFVVRPQ